MARAGTAPKGSGKGSRTKAQPPAVRRAWRWLWRRVALVLLVPVVLTFLLVLLYSFVDPPTTHTIWSEKRRLGAIDWQWIGIEEVAPAAVRAVVAAEDANYCLHWGFDVEAIRDALEDGGTRGASTISQQTVKNVFLWQGRSWLRKALEALITPVAEAAWSKRRMLEIYLNVAEFGEGVFGIDAAAHHYFGVSPGELTPMQGALLAGVLPNPKERSAARPTSRQRNRAVRVADGAATIAADGRAACFED